MSCQIDYESDDPAEFCHEEIRTAKKVHVCCECGCEIKPGQKYEYVFGKWDGDIKIFKTCFPCACIRKDLFCTWSYGYLYEDLRQYFEDRDDYEKGDDYKWLKG